ncbi:upstream stimulatory factor 1 [Lactobacillus mulieris]|jgi:SH3, type 3|nr:upstream stimulatory factor 1 [Lactobacillus mulieris]MCW8106675.1 upstream stimulatory factor 1 [Lactobacillus mulieris]MCZ3704342.1 upstream stimulatory factor 1 [Lactobacillus mulieris]MDK7327877.1 upstream stimulatory factor 1 [Lactobacillus mulieris]MDK7348423.1 upstream stimulatory factor 1 [Lactobacillus mulieris]
MQIIGMIAPSIFTYILASKKSTHDILKDNLNILQRENERTRQENDSLRKQILELMSENVRLKNQIKLLRKK